MHTQPTSSRSDDPIRLNTAQVTLSGLQIQLKNLNSPGYVLLAVQAIGSWLLLRRQRNGD
jgi:hypothetical protein